jgi:hypothetical protein
VLLNPIASNDRHIASRGGICAIRRSILFLAIDSTDLSKTGLTLRVKFETFQICKIKVMSQSVI